MDGFPTPLLRSPLDLGPRTWWNGGNEGKLMKISDILHRIMNEAVTSENGRHAEIVVNDGPLRQTLIALRSGTDLAPHNSPPAASILVLKGVIDIVGAEPDSLAEGELKALTHVRHGVLALEDSIFLLTTVTGIPGQGSHDERND